MRCWKPKQDNRSRRHPHHCERPSLPKIFLTATADRRSVLGAGLTGLLASMGWTTPVHATAASAGIDDLLDLSASAYGTVGHSVAVLRRGRLVYSRYAGLSDRETRAPITDASVYPLFSISKLFLIVELLKAQRGGLIDLNEPLGAIRAGLPPGWMGITLAKALAHVSGLPDYIPDHVEQTEDQAFAAIEALPLRFVPGTRNDYNQTNFLFARKALEQATGTPLAALVEHQCRSVGMRRTGYHVEGQPLLPGLVSSYRPAPDAVGRRCPMYRRLGRPTLSAREVSSRRCPIWSAGQRRCFGGRSCPLPRCASPGRPSRCPPAMPHGTPMAGNITDMTM